LYRPGGWLALKSDFGDILKPTRVIVGLRCTLSRSDITNALGNLEEQVELIKARAGFTKFEVVTNELGFQENHPNELKR
jgi:hypothetical protein